MKTKKQKKNVKNGIAYIHCTFNNTIVTITDLKGNALSFSSAGNNGFKGARKSTPFAAQMAAQKATQKALENGLKSIEVFIKGQGMAKDSAVKAIYRAGLKITAIVDITSLPHNGCRPPKKRRT